MGKRSGGGSDDKRVKGRRGMELRRHRMRLFPTCAWCAKRGVVRLTKVIDHIIPLAFGGLDVDENCQGLCDPCHAIKTAAENAGMAAALEHPDWLRPSGVPVSVVCGPPCAGKSAWAWGQAGDSDIVIDLVEILCRLEPAFEPWRSPIDPARYGQALRVRNALLGSLAHRRRGRAYFVTPAPTDAERLWWQAKLGGSSKVTLLAEARAPDAPPLPPIAAMFTAEWHGLRRGMWSAPRARLPRVGIGDDGYPLGG